MDYGSSANNDSLVYAQWEAIHNPAIIGKLFQSDEDGAAINFNFLAKGNREIFFNTLRILRDNISFFSKDIYTPLSKSPQIFIVSLYSLTDPKDVNYIKEGNSALGFLRRAETEIVHASLISILFKYAVFGNFPDVEFVEPGEVGNEHFIKFAPAREEQISTLASPPTVFEELYHARQYLEFGEEMNRLEYEMDVKIMKCYIYHYLQTNNIDFNEWIEDDGWGSIINKPEFYSLCEYFDILNEDVVEPSLEQEEKFRLKIIEYARTEFWPRYGNKKGYEDEWLLNYDGNTQLFDLILK